MDENIDRQEMRAYLLGTLDRDRLTQLEERLVREPDFYEELLAAEAELIDEGVARRLAESDQHQFDKHFAIASPKEVRFGTLLKRYADSHPPPLPDPPPPKTWLSFLLPVTRRPVLASLAVLVAGLATFTLCWQVTKKTAEQQALLQGESRIIEATLVPGSTTRAAGTTHRVTVPPKGPFKVKLRLELTNASFNNYKSQLFRESESLLTNDDLKIEANGAQPVVPVVIGGEFLIPGDYKLKLSGVSGSGSDEFIDNYTFRITTE